MTTAAAEARRLGPMARWTAAMGGMLVMIALAATAALGQAPRIGVPAPELGTGPWINSAPLTMAGLRGRVVLVEFWTYG